MAGPSPRTLGRRAGGRRKTATRPRFPARLAPRSAGDRRRRALRRIGLVALLGAALGLPGTAASIVEGRLAALALSLGRTAGVPVSIGAIDVDLTGSVRLERVAIGGLFEVESIEAAASAASLLSGEPQADRIRVRHPRLHLALDATGGPTARPILERMSARLASARAAGAPTTGSPGPRRITVEDGDLELGLPGGGVLRASDVEVEQLGGALRVVTGATVVELAVEPYRVSARFERGALDLELPELAARRLVLTGGALALEGGARALELSAVSLRRATGEPLRLTGSTADGGGVEVRLTDAAGGDGHRVVIAARRLPLGALGAALPHGLALDGARFTGDLALEHSPRSPLSIALDGAVSGAAIDLPLLDDRPLPIGGHIVLEGSATAIAGRRAIALDRVELTAGAVRLSGRGRVELVDGDPLPLRAELAGELAALPCALVPAALPGEAGALLIGTSAEGEVSARARLAFDRSAPEQTELDLAVDAGGCRVLAEPPRADVRRLLAGFDHRRPDGQVVRIGDGDDAIDLARLARHTPGAFVAAEDGRFWQHDGFDVEQIERSLAIDLGEGRLLRGGSTISQQLVKNVFVGADRTLSRKLAEALVTWRLEQVVPKRVILARYLEIIELGEGVFGLQAGARRYFGKRAEALTIAESAFLAALTPAPRSLERRLRAAGGLDAELARRHELVLRMMRNAGVISREDFARVSGRGVVVKVEP